MKGADKVGVDLFTGVGKAARMLDNKRPGWWQKVDIESVDMVNPRNCILQQVYGVQWNGSSGYQAGKLDLFGEVNGHVMISIVGGAFFETAAKPFWADVIAMRRAAAVVPAQLEQNKAMKYGVALALVLVGLLSFSGGW
jgi:hypothetical protein